MVCLGIDPGLGRLGYGVVSLRGSSFKSLSYGCLETSPKIPMEERLLYVYENLGKLFSSFSPDCIAVEKLYFGNNKTTAEMVWQARGVILLLVALEKKPLIEPNPGDVKIAVSGTGSADKVQVQRMVQRLLNLPELPRPDDAADGLAIAITGLLFFRHNHKVGMF